MVPKVLIDVSTAIAVTCILVFQKCREQPEDVLFIDASAYFEKAKNQNYLRDGDVDKIILTYRQRLEEDKYSYRAPLAEIAENDFNLNIPRYVDTFEEEEPIDLDAVVQEIRAVDEEMAGTDRLIRGFCEELGIEAPF
ncbi:MAG: N-6 DNA methylase [Coleofasciculus sp. G3-WIS-01]